MHQENGGSGVALSLADSLVTPDIVTDFSCMNTLHLKPETKTLENSEQIK